MYVHSLTVWLLSSHFFQDVCVRGTGFEGLLHILLLPYKKELRTHTFTVVTLHVNS